MHDIGTRVWELRQARGMTQSALARAAGCSRVFIAQLESGLRRDLSFSFAVALAAALGVTLDDLARPSSRDQAADDAAPPAPAKWPSLPWPDEPALRALAERLRARGEPFWPDGGWELRGRTWTTTCPQHGAMVRVSAREVGARRKRRTIVETKAACGCSQRRLLRAWGIEHELGQPRLTVEDLAEHVGLPADYLRGLGVRERNGLVEIPYRDATGKEVAVRYRRALRKEDVQDRVRFTPASMPIPYGLDRLREAEEARYVIIVEGESDCWTLWREGFPALGLPGSHTAHLLTPEMLWTLDRVYVVREADQAGADFAQEVTERIQAIDPSTAVYVLAMPVDAKDPTAVRRQYGHLRAWMHDAMAKAEARGKARLR